MTYCSFSQLLFGCKHFSSAPRTSFSSDSFNRRGIWIVKWSWSWNLFVPIYLNLCDIINFNYYVINECRKIKTMIFLLTSSRLSEEILIHKRIHSHGDPIFYHNKSYSIYRDRDHRKQLSNPKFCCSPCIWNIFCAIPIFFFFLTVTNY